MQNIHFYKYQGAGNDFVLIDNRKGSFDRQNNTLVKAMCDRRFGVGADGLMLLNASDDYDFEMIYFNADGFEGTMCGNGGRCIVRFAHDLGMIGKSCRFIAVDGEHLAEVSDADINLKMIDIHIIDEYDEGKFFLDTGSPHVVIFVDDIDKIKIYEEGRNVRYADRFTPDGTNVNFVQIVGDSLKIATYERGVEDETLACGTGITAAAIAWMYRHDISKQVVNISAKGGNLLVSAEKKDDKYVNVWLKGAAKRVFSGNF
ncbi:MAG: diaminopimelate epimerase [Bacteroidales bacterium]